MDFFNFIRPKNVEPSTRSLKQEAQIQTGLAKMVYEPDSAIRRTAPRRISLAANQRMRMNAGDKAIEFDRIAETYLKCENKFIEALRKSKMSIDKKLDLIVKKRDECSQSQSDIVGGRRKRRRKTHRKKKRKSRRKSRKRKRKRKTKRRR
tara:strand:- start:634 stop:1083 length:450 start_codon:yes stop_codon:yes gene_type:complete